MKPSEMKSNQRIAVELAIARKGKKKERATNVINGLKTLLAEELEGHPALLTALNVIEGYRKALDEEV